MPLTKRKYQCLNGGSINGTDRLPVDTFTIDYDVPMTLAVKLVGKTESPLMVARFK
jgi:hypothetical protein